MKLTIQLQLLPTSEQATILLDTMARVNQAATFAAQQGFDNGVFSQPSIHKLAYRAIRDQFGLSAQLAVRAIGKAVETFQRDKTICPMFRPDGAITYDERNMGFKGVDKVSLSTLAGRQIIGMVYGEYQRERFDRIKGQCDLVYRDNKFFLIANVDLPEAPPLEIKAFLGVDLGLINLATTSQGEMFSGETVNRTRRRCATARKQYQRKGTRNAKRRLKKIGKRQSRFQTWRNHNIAKQIVQTAKALGFGIAMEDLTDIRERIEDTVGRRTRRRFGNWSFRQLRDFVSYKARLAGVPVCLVDPRNTSRICSKCGYCDKANRKTQDRFLCLHCGFSLNADLNAAVNISLIAWDAFVNHPEKQQSCVFS